jgi:hypothetical protein
MPQIAGLPAPGDLSSERVVSRQGTPSTGPNCSLPNPGAGDPGDMACCPSPRTTRRIEDPGMRSAVAFNGQLECT